MFWHSLRAPLFPGTKARQIAKLQAGAAKIKSEILQSISDLVV
jgi:hypothetical protein